MKRIQPLPAMAPPSPSPSSTLGWLGTGRGHIVLMLLLLLAQGAMAAWPSKVYKREKLGYAIRDMQPTPEGYLIAGYHPVRMLWPGKTNSYYYDEQPALMWTDRDLNILREVKFPQTSAPYFNSMEVIGDRIYVGGTTEDAQRRFHAAIHCLSKDGSLLWQRKITLNGCAASSGLRLTPLPGGDFIGTVMGRACSTGNTGQFAVRLRPNGDVVWAKNFYRGRFEFYGSSNTLLLDDGNLMWVNWVTPYGNGKTKVPNQLWSYKVKMETGELMWEHLVAPPISDFKPDEFVRLPDGNFAATGEFHEYTSAGMEYRSLWVVFSQEGELVQYHQWHDADESEMGRLIASPDGYFYAQSASHNLALFGHQEEQFQMFYKFDARMNIVSRERVDVRMSGWLRPTGDGAMILDDGTDILYIRPI